MQAEPEDLSEIPEIGDQAAAVIEAMSELFEHIEASSYEEEEFKTRIPEGIEFEFVVAISIRFHASRRGEGCSIGLGRAKIPQS